MFKKSLILCCFIIFKFVLQSTLIDSGYDLHRDEYLHLDQARHLAWGYLSVPPVTSWFSYIILLLGNDIFWVKFFPTLFGVLTMIIVWKAIEELNGGIFALILGATAITLSVILRINTLFQPNSLDILCWTFLYFTILKYFKTQQNKWLWIAGITFAFGFLNKYNIVFLLAGLLPALLISPQRKVFKNPHLYLTILGTFLLILPNLIWQYENNFPVIHHMALLKKYQLVNVKRADFLKEQILFFLSSFFVLIASFISFFRYKAFKEYRFFFWAFVFSLSIFVYLQAKSYYAIGLYPILIAFGSVYLENILKESWTIYLRPVTILLIIVLFLPMMRIAFPNYNPKEIQQRTELYKKFDLLRWEDGKDHTIPQDFADMLGWKELAQKVDSVYAKIDDKEHTLVLCDNYGQAGAINYYSAFKHINAVTVNADYINWFPPLGKTSIKNIILIQYWDDDDKNREKERPLFQSVALRGKVENPFAREYQTSIYLLKGAKVPIEHFLIEDIEEEMKDWR
ncbi:glycosyltransferase family 39 protein [Arcicella lustrica]|uniref:Glycosyltransferase family 39 protein n=1 Tax=Arcicella lustrica TaxID=2984196 RepID=A0ABU5SEL0_9BACT|nr:glycosyltransferase family 39 protein [Arcicella sp. DC25W]MEA5425612.1 glycosyltransferase family 39 protein [Arcicella sp. DC25W]